MSHLAKYIVAVLLGAGVLLGGASLVDAHSKSESWWSHYQYAQTESLCAYECALKNHDSYDWDCDDDGDHACSCRY